MEYSRKVRKTILNQLARYGVYVKTLRMRATGKIYIAYRKKCRDICVFHEPVSDKIYYDLGELLDEVVNQTQVIS